MVDAVFAPAFPAAGGDVLIACYAFAFQIYGDFAGYSDIARGLSQLLGIELNVNFRFPYSVTNPREFWRHWHISLSTWLRDYLYIPLGGSRGGRWATQPQPDDHDGARRPVARRRVVVRAVGRLPGRVAGRAPRLRGVARRAARGRHAWRRSARGSSRCT